MQGYIVRILLMVPIYSIDCFLSLRFLSGAVYFTTTRELYEAYTLFNFVEFLMTYLNNYAVVQEIERDMPEEFEHRKQNKLYAHALESGWQAAKPGCDPRLRPPAATCCALFL